MVTNTEFFIPFYEVLLGQALIEIKWGYLEEYPNEATDLNSIFEKKEFDEINKAIKYSQCCRVKGPYVSSGDDIPGKFEKDFKRDKNTKFLIVGDLKGLLNDKESDFNSIKQKYIENRELFDFCDIKEDTDIFYSLENYLKMNSA